MASDVYLLLNEENATTLEDEILLSLIQNDKTYTFETTAGDEDLGYQQILRIANRVNSPSATTTQFHLLFPEYPSTSKTGICHIIPIEQWDTFETLQQRFKSIQYSTTRITQREVLKVEFLNDTPATCLHYRCGGIKYCSYLDKDLKKYYHSSVEYDKWPLIRYPKLDQESTNLSTLKELTQTFYFFLIDRYQDLRFCCKPFGSCLDGRMKLLEIQKGSSTFFTITCSNFQDNNSYIKHFWYTIKPTDPIGDITYLKSLLSTLIQPQKQIIPENNCFNVQNRGYLSKTCRFHPGYRAPELLKQDCSVEYFHIIPKSTSLLPYTFTISKGIHNHPPPPPTKTPYDIIQELKVLISHVDPTISTQNFLQSDLLRIFLQNHNITQLQDLHISLINHSIISTLLQKQRLITYPEGTDIAGVIFEYQRSLLLPSKNQYIREVWTEDKKVLIITFSQIQAELFSQCKSIQVDLTFKRVHSSINELVFITWHEKSQKVCPLARVYMKGEDTLMYKKAFLKTFFYISKVLQKPIKWQHIHGQGLGVVTVDMDASQAKGLGLYLEEIDPSRSWQQHIQSVVIYCLIHYQRGLVLKFRSSPYLQEMKNLPTSTKEQVEVLLKKLKSISSHRAWAQHKSLPYVLSGLNKYFSLMDSTLFDLALKHGNLVEVSHSAIHRRGIRDSLLNAIRKGFAHDAQISSSCLAVESLNISLNSRNITPESRLRKNHLRRINSLPLTTSEAYSDDFLPETPSKSLKSTSSHTLLSTLKRSKDFNKSTYLRVSSSGIPKEGPLLKKQKSTNSLSHSENTQQVLNSQLSTNLESTLSTNPLLRDAVECQIQDLQKYIISEAVRRAKNEIQK